MLQKKYSAHGLGGWVGPRTGLENVERHQSHAVLENKHQFPIPSHSLFTTMTHSHFVLGCLFGDVILPMGPNEFIRIRCEKVTLVSFFTSRLKSLKMHVIFCHWDIDIWTATVVYSVYCSWIDHFLVVPFLYMQKCGSVSVKWNGIYIVKISYKYVLFISAVGVVGTVCSRLHKSVSRILVFLMTEQD